MGRSEKSYARVCWPAGRGFMSSAPVFRARRNNTQFCALSAWIGISAQTSVPSHGGEDEWRNRVAGCSRSSDDCCWNLLCLTRESICGSRLRNVGRGVGGCLSRPDRRPVVNRARQRQVRPAHFKMKSRHADLRRSPGDPPSPYWGACRPRLSGYEPQRGSMWLLINPHPPQALTHSHIRRVDEIDGGFDQALRHFAQTRPSART